MAGAWGIVAQGFLVGLGVAAPIGPVNIEIIRRGLRSGFWEPFALGMGAVTADGVYLALVCLGVSHIAEHRPARLALLTVGAVVLATLGVLAFRDAARLRELPRNPDGQDEAGHRQRLARCYGLGLAMMATNPLSMAAWIGFTPIVTESASAGPMAYVCLAISVPAACATWVVFISSLLHFGRRYVNVRVLRVVNVLGGAVLCGFGLRLLLQALA